MSVILGFSGPYRFLSNFFIEPDGTHVEGEYQRAKCAIASERDRFHIGGKWENPFLPPAQCKAIGQKVELRPDWDDVMCDIMTFHVRKKFKDHLELARNLTATRGLKLIEWNNWGDQFWGMTGPFDKLRGLNMLGVILMQVRDEL